VTLVPSGIALNGEDIIPETIHDYPGQFLQSAKTQMQSGNVISLEAKKYLLVHNHWCGGYYHWVIDALSRLWISRNLLDEVVFLDPIYPAKIRKIQAESLIPFQIRETFAVREGMNMQIANLVIPTNYKYLGVFVPEIIQQLREFYHAYIRSNIHNYRGQGERIYITRKNARRRKIENEDEMLDILTSYDFTIVSAEDLTFFEQVALMYHAKFLISIYGAALTNMMFMMPGTKVFELQRQVTDQETFDPVFFRLASVSQLQYYYLFCEPVDRDEPKITANIKVDIDKFKKSMDMFMMD
jgi:capsular polysaccharide biosynthesis protein